MSTIRSRWRWLEVVGAMLLLAIVVANAGGNVQAAAPAAADHGTAVPGSIPPGVQPIVRLSARSDTTLPLREIQPIPPQAQRERVIPLQELHVRFKEDLTQGMPPLEADPVVQSFAGPAEMPAPMTNFDGLPNVNQVLPPDPDGDVGPHHYIQMVNVSFAIYDKEGNLLYGPASNNTLWAGFGGACETSDDGDPIVLYDHLADRWLMSQMAWPGYPDAGPFYECIAISQSGDPLGAWHRYQFLFSDFKLNDYPKLAVWPDAYYMTANQFIAGTFDWAGAGAVAFERDQMLQGLPARMVYFDLSVLDPNLGGLLPADLDGFIPPPEGTPGLLLAVNDNTWGYAQDHLQLWEFAVDWATPAASTVTGPQVLPTAPFNSICLSTRNCIPQPGVSSSAWLDAITDRLMFRLQYRNFGTHQSMVVNHTVGVGGPNQAGVRWYELRNDGSGWDIYQQGTYAPDGDSRWMGSIAMDAVGNLALGYSVSSVSTYPSVRYAGRLAGDPLDTLSQAEVSLIEGSGSQTHTASRWGDYSAMAVDPLDDCTFWYTQEYYPLTSEKAWHTRIGSFKFPNCTTGPTGALQGRVTDASDGSAVAHARVATGFLSTLTRDDGTYQFPFLPVGAYTLTISAYAYADAVATNVVISEGITTTLDVALEPLPTVNVRGIVSDGSGQGWPLYARIDISDYPYGPVFSDPTSGRYTVNLVQGATHTFNVQAVAPGYLPTRRTLGPLSSDRTEDFALTVDAENCSAPGYRRAYVYFEDFEADNGGYHVVEVSNSSWAWGTPTSGPGTARSGDKVWATNLTGSYNSNEHSYLLSPSIDLSAYAGQSLVLSWWQWLDTERYADVASVDVSIDDGATWDKVYGWVSGTVDNVWAEHTVLLGPEYAVPNLLISFSFRSDDGINRAGFYVDDVGIIPVEMTVIHDADFEADTNGYYQVNVRNGTWAWGVPTSGPGAAHSGSRVWATNLAGNYADYEHSYLNSPDLDLRAYAGYRFDLSWWQWFDTESCCDAVGGWVSRDGGVTWTQLYEGRGHDNRSWQQQRFSLDSSYATDALRISFSMRSDGSITYPGLYVDDVRLVGYQLTCEPWPGSLVMGYVYDANTALALNGATVQTDRGTRATSQATPDDASLDDGLYTLFAPAGERMLAASAPGGYQAVQQPVTVGEGQVLWRNFHLQAGWLHYQPTAVTVEVPLGGTGMAALTLSNDGTLPVDYELRARDQGMMPLAAGRQPPYKRRTQAYWDPSETAPLDKQGEWVPLTWGLAASLPGGPVYRTASATCDGQSYYLMGGGRYGDRLQEAWRYDAQTDAWTRLADMPFALQNMEAACIDDLIYLVGGYNAYGEHTNHFLIYDTAADTWVTNTWPNVRTPMLAAWDGKLWAFGGNPGPSSETWMYDPATAVWSGPLAPMPAATAYGAAVASDDAIFVVGGSQYNSAVNTVQRYDPVANTWTVGPALPGGRMSPALAWYGDHLYVIAGGGNYGNLWDAYASSLVYDLTAWPGGVWTTHAEAVPTPVVAPGYACVADRVYLGGGTSSSGDYDTNQYLDDALKCHAAAAGVPWLTMQPVSGTLAPGAVQPIDLALDASLPEMTQPGLYRALLNIKEDTPYELDAIPLTMRVNAPPTYGKLTGIVTSLGHCDAEPAPLADVNVFIQASSGMIWTVTTNVSGTYQLWLDEAHSPVTVTVAPADHEPGFVADVGVAGQVTTTVDFGLRWLQPCLGVVPDRFDLQLGVGYSTTLPMTLTNGGAGGLTFELREHPGWPAPASAAASGDRQEINVLAWTRYTDISREYPNTIAAIRQYFTDFNLAESSTLDADTLAGELADRDVLLLPEPERASQSELEIAGSNFQSVLQGFVSRGGTVVALGEAYSFWGFLRAAGLMNARPWDTFSYGTLTVIDAEHPLAEGLGSTIDAADATTSYDIGDADVQVVVTVWDGKPVVAARDIGAGHVVLIGYDYYDYNDDAAHIVANAVQWVEPGAGIDVPWLAAEPVSGTIPADDLQPAVITFDAAGLEPRVYSATLIILSNDPVTPAMQVPVTLTTYLVYPAISQVRTSNVRDTSFTVSWLTDVPAAAAVRYGTDPDNLNRIAFDDRAAAGQVDLAGAGPGPAGPMFETHHVTLQGLRPGTTYYFDVVSGLSVADNRGFHFQRTTGPTLGVPATDTIYGMVLGEDGVAPASGTIVYVTLRDADGLGSPGDAVLLSSLVDRDGYWSVNLGNGRTSELDSYFAYSAAGDEVVLEARTASAGSSCPAPVDTANDSPAPDIVLNAAPCADLGQMTLGDGWNLLSLPLAPEEPYRAAGVCSEVNGQGGAAVEIDRWQAGAWDGHICGVPVNDFPVELAAGYFLNSAVASNWTIAGTPVLDPLPLELAAGWTAVGVPHSAAYSAETLCGEILDQGVAAQEIDRWAAGGWEGHLCGLPFNDFAVEIGKGYFVKSATGGIVTPTLASGYAPPAAQLAQAPPVAVPARPVAVSHLQVANLRDTALTVSWTTDEPATGYVRFGEDPAMLDRLAFDVRGAATAGQTHFVLLDGLTAETTYYFDVVSAAGVDDNDGQHYAITTGPQLVSLPTPYTVYGQVFQADGVTPAAGAIVDLFLVDADGLGSAGRSHLMAALVDSHGYWQANLGNARAADGSAFAYSMAGDAVTLKAIGTDGQRVLEVVDTAALRPAESLVLGSREWLHLPLLLVE